MSKKTIVPLHSSINRIKNLRQGQTIYNVHALGKESYLSKSTVDCKPYIQNGWYEGIQVRFYSTVLYDREFFTKSISLQDMNAIPNNYNKHRMFTSRRKAESYLKLCLQGSVDYVEEEALYDPYDGWDNGGSF